MSALSNSNIGALRQADGGVVDGTNARLVAKQAAVVEALAKIGLPIASAYIACGIEPAIAEHTDLGGAAAGAAAGDVVARDRGGTEKRQKSTQSDEQFHVSQFAQVYFRIFANCRFYS